MYMARVSASIVMWKAAITTTIKIFVSLNPFRFHPNPAAAQASQTKACAPATKVAASKDRLLNTAWQSISLPGCIWRCTHCCLISVMRLWTAGFPGWKSSLPASLRNPPSHPAYAPWSCPRTHGKHAACHGQIPASDFAHPPNACVPDRR